MRMKCRAKFLLTLFSAAFFGAGGSSGSLLEKSPFLPPDFNPDRSQSPSRTADQSSPVERLLDFKGWYEIGGQPRILVSQKRRTDGGWMTVGETRNDIEVLDFDRDQERVRVRFQGNEGWLAMATLESNPSGSTPAQAATPTSGARPTTATTARGRVSPVPQRRVVTAPGSTSRTIQPPRVSPSRGENFDPSQIRQPAPNRGPTTPPPTGLPPTPVPDGPPDTLPPTTPPDTSNVPGNR